MSKVRDLHQKWMKSEEYRKEYDALTPEFELARAVMKARVAAGLTQEQLAARMQTTQSAIEHLERPDTPLHPDAHPFSCSYRNETQSQLRP